MNKTLILIALILLSTTLSLATPPALSVLSVDDRVKTPIITPNGWKTVVVPDDFPTIYEAIRNAGNNTVVLVKQLLYADDEIYISGGENITIKPYPGYNATGSIRKIYIENSRNIRIEYLGLGGSEVIDVRSSSNVTFKGIHAFFQGIRGIDILYGIRECDNVVIEDSIFENENPDIMPRTLFFIGESRDVIIRNTIIRGTAERELVYITLSRNISITGSKIQSEYTIDSLNIFSSTDIVIKNSSIGAIDIFESENILVDHCRISDLVFRAVSTFSTIVIQDTQVEKYIGVVNEEGALIHNTTSSLIVVEDTNNIVIYGSVMEELQLKNVRGGSIYFNIIEHRIYVEESRIKYYSSKPVNYTFMGRSFYGYVGNYYGFWRGKTFDTNWDGIADAPFRSGDVYDPYPLAIHLVDKIYRVGDKVHIRLVDGRVLYHNKSHSYDVVSITNEFTAIINGVMYRLLPEYETRITTLFYDGVPVATAMPNVYSFARRRSGRYMWFNFTLDADKVYVFLPEWVTDEKIIGVYVDGVETRDYVFIPENYTLVIGDPSELDILVELPVVSVNTSINIPVSINGSYYALELTNITWSISVNYTVNGYVLIYVNGSVVANITGLTGSYLWIPPRAGVYNITVRLVVVDDVYAIGDVMVSKIIAVEPRPVEINILEYNTEWINKTHIKFTLKLNVLDKLNQSIVNHGYVTILFYKNDSLVYNISLPANTTINLNITVDPDYIVVQYSDPNSIYSSDSENLVLPENPYILILPKGVYPAPEPVLLPVILLLALFMGVVSRRRKIAST